MNFILGDSASAGAVSRIAIVRVDGAGLDLRRYITAVRDGGGNLKVILWLLPSLSVSNIFRVADASAGEVSRLAITGLWVSGLASRYATVVCDGSGDLKVIVWDVTNNGEVVRRGDGSAGAVSRIALSLNVTAVRDGNGDLKVIDWDISSSGNVTRDESSAGVVSLIAIDGTMTAVRDVNGNLKLIDWNIT